MDYDDLYSEGARIIEINSTCSCGDYILTAPIDSIAGDSYRMPGIYYRCPKCSTGRFIPKDKCPNVLKMSADEYEKLDKDEDRN